MHQISVVSYLDSTNNGPCSTVHKSNEYVHLQQGQLDGACGHYSFLMILIMLGVFTREQIRRFLEVPLDGRTKIARFVSEIKSNNFFTGTELDDVINIISNLLKDEVNLKACDKSGYEIREFVKTEVLADKPVMLAIDFPGGAHWVVVVGLDYDGEGDDKRLFRFLILDPGSANPKFGFWNGAISYTK